MPPNTFDFPIAPRANSTGHTPPGEAFKDQWTHPTDVFSVLLLLGGDVVNKALGQLSGGRLTPVTFSFGWVSYAITTLLASVGDTKLMPRDSEGSCLVITAKNGYTRTNSSWVIARMLRDHDSWMHPRVKSRLEWMIDERHHYLQSKAKPGTRIPRPGQTGLCISIYEPSKTVPAGKPRHDVTYWSGIFVAACQLLLATAPLIREHDWSILVITVCGTVLALGTGSLPEWAIEKWACRRGSHNSYIVTRGNGAQHAILILGNGKGLNLEDLAVGSQMQPRPSSTHTRFILAVISIMWIGLLVSAAGMTENTSYLLAIGGIGMIHNVVVVGLRRDPSTLGIHLEYRDVVGEMIVMDALLDLEAKYPQVGASLLPIFFPGQLRLDETSKWEALRQRGEQQAEQATSSEGQQEPAQEPAQDPAPESWEAHAKTFETG